MSNGNRSLKYSGFMKLLCYSFLKKKMVFIGLLDKLLNKIKGNFTKMKDTTFYY